MQSSENTQGSSRGRAAGPSHVAAPRRFGLARSFFEDFDISRHGVRWKELESEAHATPRPPLPALGSFPYVGGCHRRCREKSQQSGAPPPPPHRAVPPRFSWDKLRSPPYGRRGQRTPASPGCARDP